MSLWIDGLMGSDMVTLLHGDTLEQMATLTDGSVDMILADLPFGVTACKWDSVIPFDKLWEQYKRIIKKNGAIVLFGSQPFTSALVMSNPKWFKYEWVWKKNEGSGFSFSKYQPMRYHENILIFCDGSTRYNPQLTVRKSEQSRERMKTPVGVGNSERAHGTLKNTGNVQYNPNFKNPESVIEINSVPNGGGNKFHPTQKPVALCEYLIRTYTHEGETVLDNTMGSGTTGVASVNTNRNFIGIERDDAYFAIATKRIEEAQLAIQTPKPQSSLFD